MNVKIHTRSEISAKPTTTMTQTSYKPRGPMEKNIINITPDSMTPSSPAFTDGYVDSYFDDASKSPSTTPTPFACPSHGINPALQVRGALSHLASLCSCRSTDRSYAHHTHDTCRCGSHCPVAIASSQDHGEGRDKYWGYTTRAVRLRLLVSRPC
jgi:hypothetical protein